jgi:hypothetical protein
MTQGDRIRVHVGYAPVLRATGQLSASELAVIAGKLRMEHVKIRLRVLTGDIDRAELPRLRAHPDVEWVEVDQKRHAT